MRNHWKQGIAMAVVAWLAGALTVTLYLAWFAVEDFTPHDLISMYVVLAVANLLLATIVSMPSLLFLRRRRQSKTTSVFYYPMVNSLIIMAIVALTVSLSTLVLKNMLVGEALFFSVAFLTSSLASGLLFAKLYGHGRAGG